MIKQIEKRDGRCVFFDVTKIANAIYKAAETSGGHDYQMSMRLALDAADYIEAHSPTETPTVEYVQDAVDTPKRRRRIFCIARSVRGSVR